jgi:hypothetical protein
MYLRVSFDGVVRTRYSGCESSGKRIDRADSSKYSPYRKVFTTQQACSCLADGDMERLHARPFARSPYKRNLTAAHRFKYHAEVAPGDE